MARRNEDFARLGSHGGYTQALTIGKGFSGAARRDARQQGSASSGQGGGGGGGGRGTMNAYARHQELIRNYHRYHVNAQVPSAGAIEAKGLPGQRRLTDDQALRRQHRFVRDHGEDYRAHEARGLEGADADPHAWEVRMAAKYYKLLFKEYALADLSRYTEDKVGLRWRTEKDVVSGKGQFECGALRCAERRDLHSYEVNFKYKEAGSVKNELVKVRVCPQCARKLFRKKIEALLRQREVEQAEADRERRRGAKAAGESLDGAVGDAAPEAEGGEGSARLSDGVVVQGGRGLSARKTISSGGGKGGTKETVSGATSNAAGGHGGHDLIRQAVNAAGGEDGARAGAAKKRARASRWGAAGVPSEAATAPSTVAVTAESTADGKGVSSGAGAVEPPSVDNASRNAWAGELERDRTAEDEMDDYLSSLLL